jgi:hypothetical protein
MKEEKSIEKEEEGGHIDIFSKHKIGELNGYVNFDHKKTMHLDSFEFSWSVQGFDLFSKFLPQITK